MIRSLTSRLRSGQRNFNRFFTTNVRLSCRELLEAEVVACVREDKPRLVSNPFTTISRGKRDETQAARNPRKFRSISVGYVRIGQYDAKNDLLVEEVRSKSASHRSVECLKQANMKTRQDHGHGQRLR